MRRRRSGSSGGNWDCNLMVRIRRPLRRDTKSLASLSRHEKRSRVAIER